MSAMLSMGRASDEGGDGAEEGRMAKRAADIMDFNLADANPVSIITQRVSSARDRQANRPYADRPGSMMEKEEEEGGVVAEAGWMGVCL